MPRNDGSQRLGPIYRQRSQVEYLFALPASHQLRHEETRHVRSYPLHAKDRHALLLPIASHGFMGVDENDFIAADAK